MAIIHYQFETIHPFIDGNGRIGRIINILYLITQDLLNYPILYLSRYIVQNKNTYYECLSNINKAVTEEESNKAWEDWVLYILDAIIKTSSQTINLINAIKNLQLQQKRKIRDELRLNFYSQDLLNSLFKHPYIKIDFIEQDLKVSRQTASSYLKQLTDHGLLTRIRKGKSYYFINDALFDLISGFDYQLR